MAEDEDVSRRYRELSREEPPRHLDEAIRAAARRAVNTRPAPLVVPSGRRRRYFPLAAAAVIVLAVAVTLHVGREQPPEEIASTAAEERKGSAGQRELREAAPARAPAPKEAPAAPAQDAASNVQESTRAEAAPKPAAPSELGAAGTAMRRAEPAPSAAPLAKLADRAPEQWLQGIAELRAQGRHDDADRELAEFRKRYPDYRIPEPMLEKVERR